MSDEIINNTKQAIIEGDDHKAQQATRQALESNLDVSVVLQEGLMAGAEVVGQKFETGEFFLPDLMLTANALKAAMAVLEPVLKDAYSSGIAQRGDTGTIVIATVQSDIHDIGKNIVSSMLSGSGFDVHDLGVDVPVKEIIKKAQQVEAEIIACSALLTTSMPFMRDLINLLDAMGERDRFKVILGGASVNEGFVKEVGADGTAANAMAAVSLAKRLIRDIHSAEGASS